MEVVPGVVVNLRQDPVRIEDGIVEIGFLVDLAVIEFLKFLGVAVAVFDMAAHDVEDDEVLFLGIDALEELQEGAVQRRFLQVPVDPFGDICRIGHQGDRRIGDADRTLVAEPVRLIAGFLGHVDDGNGFVEGLVVVEIRFRQGVFQDGDGVPDAAVGVGEQCEVRVGFHRRQPRRIGHVVRIIGVHEGPRFRFADDDDDRVGVVGRMELDGLEGGVFVVMVFGVHSRPLHIVVCVDEGPDRKGFREDFFAQGADGRGDDEQQRDDREDLAVDVGPGQDALAIVQEEQSCQNQGQDDDDGGYLEQPQGMEVFQGLSRARLEDEQGAGCRDRRVVKEIVDPLEQDDEEGRELDDRHEDRSGFVGDVLPDNHVQAEKDSKKV